LKWRSIDCGQAAPDHRGSSPHIPDDQRKNRHEGLFSHMITEQL